MAQDIFRRKRFLARLAWRKRTARRAKMLGVAIVQGDAHAHFRITPSGESALSRCASPHRTIFSWPADTCRSTSAQSAEKCSENRSESKNTEALNHSIAPHAEKTLPPLPSLVAFWPIKGIPPKAIIRTTSPGISAIHSTCSTSSVKLLRSLYELCHHFLFVIRAGRKRGLRQEAWRRRKIDRTWI